MKKLNIKKLKKILKKVKQSNKKNKKSKEKKQEEKEKLEEIVEVREVKIPEQQENQFAIESSFTTAFPFESIEEIVTEAMPSRAITETKTFPVEERKEKDKEYGFVPSYDFRGAKSEEKKSEEKSEATQAKGTSLTVVFTPSSQIEEFKELLPRYKPRVINPENLIRDVSIDQRGQELLIKYEKYEREKTAKEKEIEKILKRGGISIKKLEEEYAREY